MNNDFDDWNTKKKLINSRGDIIYFKEGEIWWIHLGLNIGHESNGKSNQYLRPVIILKKYNMHSFLSVPLTTSLASNKYMTPIGNILGKNASVNISQIRYLDSKRLAKKICTMDRELFREVRKKASEINFI